MAFAIQSLCVIIYSFNRFEFHIQEKKFHVLSKFLNSKFLNSYHIKRHTISVGKNKVSKLAKQIRKNDLVQIVERLSCLVGGRVGMRPRPRVNTMSRQLGLLLGTEQHQSNWTPPPDQFSCLDWFMHDCNVLVS